MPPTCQHCGASLTGTVDAFCPECREDLSATPEEAEETARLTLAAVTGNETPEDARARSALWSVILTGGAAVGLVASVIAREWEKVILAAVLLGLGAIWVRFEYRQQVVRTRVTGTSKTNKSTEQPK
jgi:hypothetical protein